MIDNGRKSMVLRYAQLCFQKQGLAEQKQTVPPEVDAELGDIRGKLGLPHEKILELAAQNLVDPDNHST